MTIELFTLCDGAYNYNGKLTIVGALSSVTVSKLPAKVQMAVAMKIRVEADEEGSRQMIIRFVSPDGKDIPTDLVVDLNLDDSKVLSYISLAASIQGMSISQTGHYTVKVMMDQKMMAEYPFVVNQKGE